MYQAMGVEWNFSNSSSAIQIFDACTFEGPMIVDKMINEIFKFSGEAWLCMRITRC